MAMRTPTLSAGSGGTQGAWAGYFPSRPLKNPPKFAPKTPAGLDFSVSLGVDSCAVLPPILPSHNQPNPSGGITMTSLRVSTSTLWAWERHNCPPVTMEPVRRVAAVLGVEPEELLEPVKEAQP